MYQLLKYLKTCKKQAILTPIFVILEVIMEILIPVLMGILLDQGIKKNNFTLVYQYGILMVLLAILALFFGVMASRFAARVSTEFARNIRKDMYQKIQDYSFENIDHFSTSSLITRMTNDVNMLQMAMQMNIRITFRAPAMLLFSIIMSFVIAGKLGFVFVAVVPLIAFSIYLIMKFAHRHFVKMFKKIDHMNLTVQEDLIGIRTIKSFVREDYSKEKFNKSITDVSENAKKAEKIIIFMQPVMQLAICITFVLIAWFGARQMVFNGFTEGQFTNIVTYIMQVLVSLMMLSQVFLMLVMSKESRIRIQEVLNEEPALKEATNPLFDVKDGSIEFNHVYFGYSQKEVLKDINFKVESGSFLGIVGATGSGKTTLIQLVSRLYDTTQGEVLIGGEDVKALSLDTLRQTVNTVLQKNVLFSGTIRDNIRWGKKDATDDEIMDVIKKAQAYEFVSQMPNGLDTWIEQGGVNVSGGQRQRLCIARALIKRPKILIMDDSTSAVDTKTDALIKKALGEEMSHMTKIVVAQRISSIMNADQIIVLKQGEINGIGTHERLVETNKIYQEMYTSQNKGSDEV